MDNCHECARYEHCYERHTIEKCKNLYFVKAKLFCKKCGMPLRGIMPWVNLCDKCALEVQND